MGVKGHMKNFVVFVQGENFELEVDGKLQPAGFFASRRVDAETEEEIMQEIINFRKNKTIIMSTHKQNLLNYCDKIYEIEKNKLINNS